MSFGRVGATPSVDELHEPVQAVAIQMAETLDVELKPEALLEPIRTRVTNPSVGGAGYTPNNCTSFVAIERERLGMAIPRDLGNAATWAVRAAADGIPTGKVPYVGAVVVFDPNMAGGLGHVAIVSEVGPTGVAIREQNYSGPGVIGKRVLPLDSPVTYVYE